MGALSKIQHREHAKTGMTGKEQVKTLKRLNLIPRNRDLDEQMTLAKYAYVFMAGLLIGIFTQIL